MTANKLPLIGITCSTNYGATNAKGPMDKLNAAYSHSILLAGGIPVILPTIADESFRSGVLASLDGLLLSGGVDCDPSHYGQQIWNDTVEVDPRRDEAEFPLIRAALATNIPLLAICRGFQTLNVAMGGSLIQDIPSQRPSEIAHRQTEARHVATHSIEVIPKTRLAGLIGESMQVNSFHHQAIDRVGHGLVVTARAPDGMVEGLEMAGDRWVVAMQFHPEEMTGDCSQALEIFWGFVGAARVGD